ncbi:uncharacterized protein LOC142925596 [Petromyzon marinus]|uniref:uncharacterized protein LOC142925596 n=1 Tax=Petromyzon marinus TaxID=7757 RepID=UPI003F72BD74
MRELALAAAAEAEAAAGRPGPAAAAATRPGSRPPRPLAARPLVPPARDPLSARVLLSARPPRGPPLPFVLQELSLRGAAAATARPRWGADPEGNATRPRGRAPRGSDDATLAGAESPTRSEPEPRAAGRLDGGDGDDGDEYDEEYEEEGDAEPFEATGHPRRRPRARRQAAERRPPHRAELAVCDSENVWVTDKAHAVDLKGHNVTVLSDIRVEGTALRQYFFETRCRASRHTRDGCRGIDRAHWSSQCRTVQSFVQALTSKGGRNLGWRWIRIDTACVCALSQRRP